MNDQALADDISRAIYNLNAVVHQARERKLVVYLTTDNHGQTITSRVSREYDFDLTKGDEANG